jgi:hypothetical protein
MFGSARIMLKKDFINGIILILFSALMHEFLTTVTLVFVIVGVLITWLQFRPGTLIRNALALIVFASYWFTYGKVIDPEIGINFLTSIIVIKLLERETERDDYMIFYGLILIVATGSLFVKNLIYLSFFIVSFFTLIILFYYQLGLKLKFSQLIKNILWVAPVTFLFFFLTPRLMSPIPLNPAPTPQGEVGYRPDVNLSEIDTLNLSSGTVFEAKVGSKIPQNDLYWRGNTLSFTDGWNWPLMSQDRSNLSQSKIVAPLGIKQIIRLESQFQFYFGLDKPVWIKTGRGSFNFNSNFAAEQFFGERIQRYEIVSSSDTTSIQNNFSNQIYLRKGLNKFEREWIETNFKSNNFLTLTKEVENYLKENNFIYTLSPGKIQSFQEFREKKAGFCSHYASTLALILRTKGIPTRLVSGFHGGVYNPYSGTYLISQNDAHVWVESYVDDRWQRIDPTLWIAPDRVELGGEAFLQKVSGRKINWERMPFSSQLRELSLWLNQWDFKFYNWLENIDYQQQLLILKRFNIRREYLFSIITFAIVFFLFLIILKQKIEQRKTGEIEKLWTLFRKKMSFYDIDLSLSSMRDIEYELERLTPEKQIKSKMVLKDLIELTFAGDSAKKMNDICKKIKSI